MVEVLNDEFVAEYGSNLDPDRDPWVLLSFLKNTMLRDQYRNQKIF